MIAPPLLYFQLKLPLDFPVWPAVMAAFGVSALSLCRCGLPHAPITSPASHRCGGNRRRTAQRMLIN